MSFENGKQGLQEAAEIITLAMNRGAFGFDDIEKLSKAKTGIVQQYQLLEGGLSAILGGQEEPQELQQPQEPNVPEIKMAIPQPRPEEKATTKK